MQIDYSNGYWGDWSLTYGDYVLSDDCPGYQGRPSGKLVTSAENTVSGDSLTFNKPLDLQAGIHYRFDMAVQFDGNQQCTVVVEVGVQLTALLVGTNEVDVAGYATPGQWTPVWGSFIAGDTSSVIFRVTCYGSTVTTIRISDIVLSQVSPTVYGENSPTTGMELIKNPGFEADLNGWFANSPSGVSYSTPSGAGIGGGKAFSAYFPGFSSSSTQFVIVTVRTGEAETLIVTKGALYSLSLNIFVPSNGAYTECDLAVYILADGAVSNRIYRGLFDTVPVDAYFQITRVFAAIRETAEVIVDITCIGTNFVSRTYSVDETSAKAVVM